MFYYSRDRGGEHPARHLASYSGILQADAYGGYNKLYQADRKPGSIVEAACWAHARRPFFVLADLAANARRKAQGKPASVISPLALEAVRRIDALFEIERAINGQSAERRKAVRQELSGPLVADLEAWMRAPRARLSRGNDVAKAMDYMLKLDRVHAHLPVEQRGRARCARDRFGAQVVVVLRLGSRGRACRGHVQPDRHSQDERRRSASLARRRF